MHQLLRKLKCMLYHNHYTIEDYNIEKFENDHRAITIYECKYCQKPVLVVTNYVKANFTYPSPGRDLIKGDKKEI